MADRLGVAVRVEHLVEYALIVRMAEIERLKTVQKQRASKGRAARR